MRRGDTFTWTIAVKNADGSNYSFTNHTATCEAFGGPADTQKNFDFDIELTSGQILIEMSAEDSAMIRRGALIYFLKVVNTEGKSTWLNGRITVNEGLFDGVVETSEIVINAASTSITLSVGAQGTGGSSSVTWEEVEDKPATFPPSSHNHDERYNPNHVVYANKAAALAAWPEVTRRRGLTLNVDGTEYWFKDGVADSQFIVKSTYSGYDIIARETFLNQKEVQQDISGNYLFAGGELTFNRAAAATAAFIEWNQSGLPAAFLGAMGISGGFDTNPGAAGLFLSDGGAGLIDGAGQDKWSNNLGMIFRILIPELNSDPNYFQSEFGLFDEVDSSIGCRIKYTQGSLNWIIDHDGFGDEFELDSGIPVVANQWVELRVDILKTGYVQYYINGVSIVAGANTAGIKFGMRAITVAGDIAFEGKTIIDDIKIIEF